MPASEETGSGPVIHDRRRIDPVTGQVRGKHAASKPAGTSGAGRPAAAPQGPAGPAGSTGPGPAEAPEPAGARDDPDSAGTPEHAPDSAGTPEHHPDSAGTPEHHPDSAGTPEHAPDSAGTPEPAAQAGQVMTGHLVDGGEQAADLAAQLEERTADLQRLQAEYANYRKRVDRDRAAVREQAVAGALAGLLPVLDAIDQAREHGELSGGFKSVADSLQAALGRLGLVTYGETGDPFDPKVHEALTSSYSSDVAEDTCVEILQPGYKVGERILRPARVAVAAPATGPDGVSNEPGWPADEEVN